MSDVGVWVCDFFFGDGPEGLGYCRPASCESVLDCIKCRYRAAFPCDELSSETVPVLKTCDVRYVVCCVMHACRMVLSWLQ
jgi:hypothetical protein